MAGLLDFAGRFGAEERCIEHLAGLRYLEARPASRTFSEHALTGQGNKVKPHSPVPRLNNVETPGSGAKAAFIVIIFGHATAFLRSMLRLVVLGSGVTTVEFGYFLVLFYCVSNREFLVSCGSARCNKGISAGSWRERR
jgi:hypothetical protein